MLYCGIFLATIASLVASAASTEVPTSVPTAKPTAKGTTLLYDSGQCAPYDQQSGRSCNFETLCAGSILKTSGSCTGLSYFSLVDFNTGEFLASAQSSMRDQCPQLVYARPQMNSTCTKVSLQQSCVFYYEQCAGTTTLSVTPMPNNMPWSVFASTYQSYCEPYNAVYTNDAQQYYATCSVDNVCPGQSIVVYSSAYTNTMALRFFDPSGSELTTTDSDDGGLIVTMPSSWAACGIITIHEGCTGNSECSGQASVLLYQATGASTPMPTTVLYGSGQCAPYSNSAFSSCIIDRVCPGNIYKFSGNCSSDTSFTLMDVYTGETLASASSPYAGQCPELEYARPQMGSCTKVSLQTSCMMGSTCSGVNSVMDYMMPYNPSSYAYVYEYETFCSSYNAVYTNNAEQYYALCYVYNVCPGQSILVNSHTSSGKTALKFVDGFGSSLSTMPAPGSQGGIVVTIPQWWSSCGTITIQQGCDGNSACAAQVGVINYNSGSSPMPTMPYSGPYNPQPTEPMPMPNHQKVDRIEVSVRLSGVTLEEFKSKRAYSSAVFAAFRDALVRPYGGDLHSLRVTDDLTMNNLRISVRLHAPSSAFVELGPSDSCEWVMLEALRSHAFQKAFNRVLVASGAPSLLNPPSSHFGGVHAHTLSRRRQI